jgi:hypothetical protein
MLCRRIQVSKAGKDKQGAMLNRKSAAETAKPFFFNIFFASESFNSEIFRARPPPLYVKH